MENESPQSLGAGHVGGTVFFSKRVKKVFSLSGNKMPFHQSNLTIPLIFDRSRNNLCI
jgi:hypothetical protein